MLKYNDSLIAVKFWLEDMKRDDAGSVHVSARMRRSKRPSVGAKLEEAGC